MNRLSIARSRLPAALGLVALAMGLWAFTGPGQGLRAEERDHELARQALQQGKVLPLRAVLDKVEQEYQGQAIKVEFEHDDGRFLYEIRLLQAGGKVVKLKVDAMDGRVLGVKRKDR